MAMKQPALIAQQRTMTNPPVQAKPQMQVQAAPHMMAPQQQYAP